MTTHIFVQTWSAKGTLEIGILRLKCLNNPRALRSRSVKPADSGDFYAPPSYHEQESQIFNRLTAAISS